MRNRDRGRGAVQALKRYSCFSSLSCCSSSIRYRLGFPRSLSRALVLSHSHTHTHTLTGRSTQCNIVLPCVRRMKESIFHSSYQMGIVSTRHTSQRGSHGQIRQNLSLCFHHILLLLLLCCLHLCLSCCSFSLPVSFSAMKFGRLFSLCVCVCGCHVLFPHMTSDLVNSHSIQLCVCMCMDVVLALLLPPEHKCWKLTHSLFLLSLSYSILSLLLPLGSAPFVF